MCASCTSGTPTGVDPSALVGSCATYTSNLASPTATISSGTPYDATQTAMNAFDGSLSTYSTLASSSSTFIGQDFGASAQDVIEVILNGTVDYGFNALLQYSDDNATWTSTGVTIDVPPQTTTAMMVSVPDSGAHRYWRFLDQGKYAWMEIAEVELFACAPSPSPSPSPTPTPTPSPSPSPSPTCSLTNVATATATISSGNDYDPTQPAADAFDNDPMTYATLASSSSTFIGQDFGATPEDVLQLVLDGTVTYGFNALLQYSDDDVNWSSTGVTVDVPPNTTMAMTVSVPDSGTHRYWRFLDQGKYAWMEIATVEMMACASASPSPTPSPTPTPTPSPTPACTSYSSFASAATTISSGNDYDPTQAAANAFDNDPMTYATLASSSSTFIGQDFGATPEDVLQLVFNGTVTYGFNALLQYSDDDVTWSSTGVTVDVPPNTTMAMTVNVPDSGTHRYWRFLDQGKYAWMEIATVQMLGCAACTSLGSNLSTAAATLSNGTPYDSSQAAANAFDGSLSTYATLASSASTFIGQDFGAAAQDIRQVVLNGTVDFGFNAQLQYSDDAVSWTSTSITVDVPPNTTTAVTVSVGSHGTHRYWRFLDQGKYPWMEIAEVGLYACASSSCNSFIDKTSAGATLSSGTPYDSTQTSPNAFDGNAATYSTLASGASTFIGQDFGTGQDIRQLVLNGTVDYGFNAALQYSDDDATWTSAGVTVDVPPNTTVAMTISVASVGPHRYWRFLDGGKYAWMEIATVQMEICGP